MIRRLVRRLSVPAWVDRRVLALGNQMSEVDDAF